MKKGLKSDFDFDLADLDPYPLVLSFARNPSSEPARFEVCQRHSLPYIYLISNSGCA